MTKPYKYQLDAARRIHKFGGRALLASEPGTGKSLMSLLYAEQHDLWPLVIVCPASIKWNWENEIHKHVEDEKRIVICNGTKGGRLPRADAYIVNYDILSNWIDSIHAVKPRLIVLDEVHFIGDRKSKRTKASVKLCKGIPHVLGLSGTPFTSRPVAMYPMLGIIKPSLFPSFFPFAVRYCAAHRGRWGWDFKGASNLEELHKILSESLMIRHRKEDVLKGLPDKRRVTVPIPIEEDVTYQNSIQECLNTPGSVKALAQLNTIKRLIGVLKQKAVIEWVESFLDNSEEKLLLFGIHKKFLKEIAAKFPCVLLTGETPQKDREAIVRRFQSDKKCRLFVGNIQAAGVGLNLTAASNVAFAELGWTPGEHLQAEDRVHRIGATNKVSIYYLIAKGTLEEHILKVIQKKQKVFRAAIDGGKAESTQLAILEQLRKGMR